MSSGGNYGPEVRVRESSASVTEQESLTDLVWANAERFADAIAFRRRVDGSWIDVTTKEFAARVLAAAKGLIASGLLPGDRVALLSGTRYEWTLADFAVWAAGGVTVAVPETSSAERVACLLAETGARFALVEGDADRFTGAVKVWRFDTAIDELAALGSTVDDRDAHDRRLAVRSSDTATVVYTAGTTGRPKGVELTHRNLLAGIRADIAAFPQLLRPGNSMLLFRPLAQMSARAIALACVYSRTTLGHLPDARNLVSDLATFRPTFLVAVPRVFERVHAAAKRAAHAEGRGRMFDRAEALAVEFGTALAGPGPSAALRVRHAVASRLVYARLRTMLGGRCVAAVSGGAPLGEHLAHFFRGVGIPVYEGYGLTETSAAICVNTAAAARVGTVGRPLAGVAVRIAVDGEIQVRGERVCRGYWRDPGATAAALDDGWLRTGDLGALDAAGYLRVTGRKRR